MQKVNVFSIRHRIFFTNGCKTIHSFTSLQSTIRFFHLVSFFLFIFHRFEDSKDDAIAYLDKKRPFTPAVYNLARSGGRTTEQTNLLSANEYNTAVSTNFSVLTDRFIVKKEKFCEEISQLRNRVVGN